MEQMFKSKSIGYHWKSSMHCFVINKYYMSFVTARPKPPSNRCRAVSFHRSQLALHCEFVSKQTHNVETVPKGAEEPELARHVIMTNLKKNWEKRIRELKVKILQ